jgi:uncharacterized membrane protein
MIRILEKDIYRAFIISLYLKAANSVLELIGGTLLLFTGALTSIVGFLVKNELIEDPNDFVANQIQHLIPYLSGHSQLFGALYLLSHGIIKIFLVINLLRNRLWAYPATIVTLMLFIVYQLYRLSYAYSIFLVFLTLFDILIIILTWHEYGVVKRHNLQQKAMMS